MRFQQSASSASFAKQTFSTSSNLPGLLRLFQASPSKVQSQRGRIPTVTAIYRVANANVVSMTISDERTRCCVRDIIQVSRCLVYHSLCCHLLANQFESTMKSLKLTLLVRYSSSAFILKCSPQVWRKNIHDRNDDHASSLCVQLFLSTIKPFQRFWD